MADSGSSVPEDAVSGNSQPNYGQVSDWQAQQAGYQQTPYTSSGYSQQYGQTYASSDSSQTGYSQSGSGQQGYSNGYGQSGYADTGYSQQTYAQQPYANAQSGYGYFSQGYYQQGYYQAPVSATPLSDKSKVAAGVLGILLPGLGAHNFYLGNTGKAVLQLVLSIVTFGAASIWGFIEGILILSSSTGSKWHQDASGRELQD